MDMKKRTLSQEKIRDLVEKKEVQWFEFLVH
jgi:hypothetical protein